MQYMHLKDSSKHMIEYSPLPTGVDTGLGVLGGLQITKASSYNTEMLQEEYDLLALHNYLFRSNSFCHNNAYLKQKLPLYIVEYCHVADAVGMC